MKRRCGSAKTPPPPPPGTAKTFGFAALRRPEMRDRWTLEQVHLAIGKPADWEPATREEGNAAFEACVDLLRAPGTKSGYKEVYPFRNKWQAKPYIAPGKQRSLGLFAEPRRAAEAIFNFNMGMVPLPPSPKAREKRGAGSARQRQRKSRPKLQPLSLIHI